MKEHEIYLNDWSRILAGDVPPAFYLELVFRAAFMFFLLMICMRLLGKRMAAQLSRNDMAALVSLAAAIGVPIVAQDRGLLPSTIIAIIVVVVVRASARLNATNKRAEVLTVGDVSTMVEDGILQVRNLRSARLPRERVLAQLRSENVYQLGEVKRLYMESSGDFSLLRNPSPKPGLLAIPAYDKEYVNRVVKESDTPICLQCGMHVAQSIVDEKKNCPNCNSDEFTRAVERK